jgi:dihydroorotate dehydrogenase electron transfer subunit
MIRKESLKILSKDMIAQDTFEMVLENQYISQTASPGQFLHIRVGKHTLRRPISIANCNPEDQEVTILFRKDGSGTSELANYSPGEDLDVLGPIGNGFNTIKDQTRVLLIGGGIGVPPLYYLGRTMVEKGIKIVSVLGFQTAESVFYEKKFKELGETIVVTNDGSYGSKGFVTDVLEQVGDYGMYYSCGPKPMLQALMAKLPKKKGLISLEERMGCGVGACFACVLQTKDYKGYKKICKDGPVFCTEEVLL